MLSLKIKILFLLIVLLGTSVSYAHHSIIGYYDRQKYIEIEGRVGSVHWRNPHIKFTVEVASDTQDTIEWEVELAALSILRSRGLGDQFLHAGDAIKVQGNPALNGNIEMGGTHILLPDGKEIVVAPTGKPYFTNPDNPISLAPKFTQQQIDLATKQADGIFRVWSTVLNDPSFPMFKGGYPVTESTKQAQENWDGLAPERFECWEKGMPYLMVSPHPIEFVRDGEDILIRFEEDDATRRIHMSQNAVNDPEEYFHLGYSTGKWQDQTLVVETINISAANFDDAGTPQSRNIHLIEYFTLSNDNARLDYRLSVNDPFTFTKPFELTRFWAWVPGRQVGEWNCQT